jgi:hypothetical protein
MHPEALASACDARPRIVDDKMMPLKVLGPGSPGEIGTEVCESGAERRVPVSAIAAHIGDAAFVKMDPGPVMMRRRV